MRLASLAMLTLKRASPPPEVGDRAEDRAMTVPGARGVAALLSPARLEESQHDQAPVDKPVVRGISGRVRGVGLFGPLLKQLERLAILPGPLPQRRIRDRPRELQLTRVCPIPGHHPHNGSELFRRSPEIGEGILFVRKPEGPERRDIERVADVREAVEAVEPPDGESRGGDGNAGRQDDDHPQQLAEPLAQQLTDFEGLPLTVTRLSDRVGMIAASPGEARSAAGLSGHPNPSARSCQ